MNFTTASRSSLLNVRNFSIVHRASLCAFPCHMIASITLRARQSCRRSPAPVQMADKPRHHNGVVRHQPVRISFSIYSRCCTKSLYGQMVWSGYLGKRASPSLKNPLGSVKLSLPVFHDGRWQLAQPISRKSERPFCTSGSSRLRAEGTASHLC